MNITLTAGEKRVIQSALVMYRERKAAEALFKKNARRMDEYGKVLDFIKRVETKLS